MSFIAATAAAAAATAAAAAATATSATATTMEATQQPDTSVQDGLQLITMSRTPRVAVQFLARNTAEEVFVVNEF